MDLFTMDQEFRKVKEIDAYNSAIWTERYYGDGDFTLVVPATPENVQTFKPGTKMGLYGSDEVNILQTQDIEEGQLTATGISLLKWMDNRFVRTSADHEAKTWVLSPRKPGNALRTIVQEMLISGTYLNGGTPIGIPTAVLNRFKIPNLSIVSYDNTGFDEEFAIPFGPVYEVKKNIATTYEIGMQITLLSVTDSSYSLGYKNYKGLDRTSGQSANSTVRFSPDMETLTGIKELQSSEDHKNLIYAFASQNVGLSPTAQFAGDNTKSGFDLQVGQVWADNISAEDVPTSTVLNNLLKQQAASSLDDHKYVALVDGEIVPTGLIVYGVHYSLGDIVDLKGHSNVVSKARITEYIRVDDENGERAYPTVAMIE